MTALQEYKCPCCDGSIAFDAGTQKLKCPYCGTEFEIETLASYNDELAKDKEDNMVWRQRPENEWTSDGSKGIGVYVCQSCAGEIVCDENTAATSCPYCSSPIVVTGKVSGLLKPDKVIPFKIDKKTAVNAISDYCKGKILLPKTFKDQNRIELVKGMYVPFWLFDADADAHIRYKATKIRCWSDSSYNYTETSHFSLIREGSLGFQDVPVDGSTKMDDELMESIEPFDVSQAVDFQTAYLAGFFADKYDVDAETSIVRANERIKKSTEQAFASTVYGYSGVVPVASNVSFSDGKTKYALYPVWLLNTRWKDKTYYFAVNGQTGKVAGDLPMDKAKYRLIKWGLFFGVSTLLFLIMNLLEGLL